MSRLSVPRSLLIVGEHGDVCTVGFGGSEIRYEDAEIIGEQLSALANCHRKLLVNLGGVHYLSSAGFGKLIALRTKMEASGGRLVLCCPERQVQEKLAVTNLDKFFTVGETIRKALTLFTD